jgi:hypothetical protein
MSYEPRGKLKILVDAMRAEPERVWTSPEVAKLMDVQQGALTAHLDSAIRNGAIFRRMAANRCQYSARPFEAPAAPAVVEPPKPPAFVPPQMTAPRAGSDVPAPSRAPGPPRPPAPTPAPVLVPAPAVQADAEVLEEEPEAEEEVEFDYCVYRNGAMQLWGVQVNVDGSVSIAPEQLMEIRARVAWLPPSKEAQAA